MEEIDGLLLDIDGVLAVSWEPIPGAVDAIARLRASDVPFRLITNTTTHTRADLAATLRDAGFDVHDEELITAVVATAEYLRANHPGAPCYVLSDGNAAADLEGVQLAKVEDAQVVVIGGACDDFTYAALNSAFARLMDGAAFVAMHRNLYWRTSAGLQLDAGAFIAGLERASGVEPVVCGKPSAAFFDAALAMLGTTRERTAMVGDDIANDVVAAQDLGMTGVLVRTGKFQPSDMDKGTPDHVLDSIAELPGLLRPS